MVVHPPTLESEPPPLRVHFHPLVPIETPLVLRVKVGTSIIAMFSIQPGVEAPIPVSIPHYYVGRILEIETGQLRPSPELKIPGFLVTEAKDGKTMLYRTFNDTSGRPLGFSNRVFIPQTHVDPKM